MFICSEWSLCWFLCALVRKVKDCYLERRNSWVD